MCVEAIVRSLAETNWIIFDYFFFERESAKEVPFLRIRYWGFSSRFRSRFQDQQLGYCLPKAGLGKPRGRHRPQIHRRLLGPVPLFDGFWHYSLMKAHLAQRTGTPQRHSGGGRNKKGLRVFAFSF